MGIQNREKVISDFSLVKDPVSRASAYISLYENMLGIRYYVAGIIAFLPDSYKNTELNLRLITGYISGIYWGFLNVYGAKV